VSDSDFHLVFKCRLGHPVLLAWECVLREQGASSGEKPEVNTQSLPGPFACSVLSIFVLKSLTSTQINLSKAVQEIFHKEQECIIKYEGKKFPPERNEVKK
jgi:hypothetical protein